MKVSMRKKGYATSKTLSLIIFSMVLATTALYYFLYSDALSVGGSRVEEFLSVDKMMVLLLTFLLLHILLIPLATLQNKLCQRSRRPKVINSYSINFFQPKKKSCELHYSTKQEV